MTIDSNVDDDDATSNVGGSNGMQLVGLDTPSVVVMDAERTAPIDSQHLCV